MKKTKKILPALLSGLIGAILTLVIAACVPGQTPGQIAKTVIKDIVDDGEKTCVVIQNVDATTAMICALVDDWGPLVDHVLARKAKMAAEKKTAAPDGGH